MCWRLRKRTLGTDLGIKVCGQDSDQYTSYNIKHGLPILQKKVRQNVLKRSAAFFKFQATSYESKRTHETQCRVSRVQSGNRVRFESFDFMVTFVRFGSQTLIGQGPFILTRISIVLCIQSIPSIHTIQV
jgi:hypothetical protein